MEGRTSFHHSGNPENGFQSQSDRSSLPSMHFLSDSGASVLPYNFHQQVSIITRPPAVPPHLPTPS